MSRIVSLCDLRCAKQEKTTQLATLSNTLLTFLDQHREEVSTDHLAFLLAMAITDQSLYLDTKNNSTSNSWNGKAFIQQVLNTAILLLDSQKLNHTPEPAMTPV